MSDYAKLVEDLKRGFGHWYVEDWSRLVSMYADAAAAIEELKAEVKRLQGRLCDWFAVCPKERRRPDDCELIGENPVMYGPSGAKMQKEGEGNV